MLHPDAAEITRVVTAAAKLTMHGVLRFITRAGHDLASIYTAASAKLMADTPLKTD